METVNQEKDLFGIISSNLKVAYQCMEARNIANNVYNKLQY